MSVISRLAFIALGVALVATPAVAQIVTSKGTASAEYAAPAQAADARAEALKRAKVNALERYIAESNPAKQRLFDAARSRLMASLDDFILTTTVLSEADAPANHAYSVVVRVEINSARFENALGDASGSSAVSPSASTMAIVVLSRAPSSIQSFDDRVYKREDVKETGSQSGKMLRSTKEGESVGQTSVGTADTVNEHQSYSGSGTSVVESGGSTTRKADDVKWAVTSSNDVDQAVSSVLADAGLQVTEAEYLSGLDLTAVRKDFGRGDDLSPTTARALAAAVHANGIRYVIVGTMDETLPDRDPVSGAQRVFVTVNARITDVSGPFPRLIAAVGPIQDSGVGPSTAVARTNALKQAAEDVAKQLVDKIAVKGVR